MKNVLPADITQKQGQRVMDKKKSVSELLKHHADAVEEIKDTEQISSEAD